MMWMKKRFMAAVMGILLFLCNSNVYVRAADSDEEQFLHRSNVVFVTDESGSMKQTDPANNRYEAIRLFLGEMADEGNYVGSVSFGEGLVDSSDIKQINGQEAKDTLLGHISDQKFSNYTNIGLGLMEAVDMLDKDRNRALDSAIILLTDGNTDMPDDELRQESIEMKAEAMERARQAGYRIYTICLNVNGAADSAEMKQIAEATGGEFAEVTDPEDLNDVETMFNKLIFNSFEDMNYSDLELVVGEDGTVATDFEIPGVGIEEINVLFQGELADCELVDPDNNHYPKGDDSIVVVKGANFLLAKVKNPVGGKWQAVAYGDPDAVIGLRLLYIPNFYVDAEVVAPSEVHVGDSVKILAYLGTADGIVADTSKYEGTTAMAYITCGEKEDEHVMELTSDGFLYEMPVDDQGTYYIRVTAENAGMTEEAKEVFEVSVGNLAPVLSDRKLIAHANIWPFIGGSAGIDLTGAAVDPEGQELTYSINSTAFTKDDYSFDGRKLTVNKFSIPKGSFTVKAEDPHGAYCTFDVMFTSTDIGLIMGILVLIVMITVIVGIALGIRAAMGKALVGTLSVASYDKVRRYPPLVRDYGRGKIPLDQFAVDVSTLPEGCKFQCDGGRRQIWFISKKPVYSDNTIGAVKKIRISGDGMEVRICGDGKMEKGISVTFKSDKPDPMGIPY